ncbi:HD superfamily phosphohydrolase, partial [groundwater metagenome]
MPDNIKFIRDPIYGFIELKNSEIRLMDSPFLQRLRRIKQLGNTHLVYPSACHSRFEHSLGVLHVANRMAHQIRLPTSQIRVVRYAAMLHDIGHGPLSHNFEDIIKTADGEKVSHEDIAKKIIKEDRLIGNVLDRDKESVLELFDEENETAIKEIISSNIDADKLDYLRRDSYHTGVAYGAFDLERILHTISKKEEADRSYLTILWKG